MSLVPALVLPPGKPPIALLGSHLKESYHYLMSNNRKEVAERAPTMLCALRCINLSLERLVVIRRLWPNAAEQAALAIQC